MKSVQWKTYRTRFLVQAKQLNSALSFVDALGRTHCGRKGDYLVESSDGVISIAPRQIFEDIYVAMPAAKKKLPQGKCCEDAALRSAARFEPLVIAEVKLPGPASGRKPSALVQPSSIDPVARLRRKLPQPCRADGQGLPAQPRLSLI